MATVACNEAMVLGAKDDWGDGGAGRGVEAFGARLLGWAGTSARAWCPWASVLPRPSVRGARASVGVLVPSKPLVLGASHGSRRRARAAARQPRHNPARARP